MEVGVALDCEGSRAVHLFGAFRNRLPDVGKLGNVSDLEVLQIGDFVEKKEKVCDRDRESDW